jgi:hypothetical protein
MPDWKAEIRKRLAGLSLAPAREAEIVEELSQHLEDRLSDLVASGTAMADAVAATAAELEQSLALELRHVERNVSQEQTPLGARGGNFIGGILQDLLYGSRVLAKSRGFTATALLMLALGIGANTAIFQLIDAVRLRSLPVDRPQELADVHIVDATGVRGSFDTWNAAVTNPIWEQIRDNQQAFPEFWPTAPLTLTSPPLARRATRRVCGLAGPCGPADYSDLRADAVTRCQALLMGILGSLAGNRRERMVLTGSRRE